MAAMAAHVRAMLAFKQRGAVVFDYGNNIRGQALAAGVAEAFEIPGFVPEYIRPLFCEGKGPFRWAALSGDPADIAATDDLALDMFAGDAALCRWIRLARERVVFQGLPARIFWLGYGDRAKFGLAINDLVRRGIVAAPIVIGRDHLDAGSVASPNRETEGMRDGSDAIADWPVLNALLNTVLRRHLGVRASRRRCGNRQFDPCGHGRRRRRHARGGREAPARVDVRSWARRRATR